jgi:thymidylate synthase (FAD)
MSERYVEPEAHIIAESKIDSEGMTAMLASLGVPDWRTDALSEAEYIIEVAGKMCYMSFDTKLNDNLTRTGGRDNFEYISEGIVATKHGSVLEHCTVTMAFLNVSRVLTHELVRHRAGAAYSQTSGRYVRTGKLQYFLPKVIRENKLLAKLFDDSISYQEAALAELVEASGITTMGGKEGFSLKKQLTSAFRRIVGNGVSNNIIVTYNHRALRHIIEMRTSRHAEEEIRILFEDVYKKLSARFPAIYADAKIEEVEDIYEVTFKHGAV